MAGVDHVVLGDVGDPRVPGRRFWARPIRPAQVGADALVLFAVKAMLFQQGREGLLRRVSGMRRAKSRSNSVSTMPRSSGRVRQAAPNCPARHGGCG